MRHNQVGRKLGRTTSHRTALLRNLATSLFAHERITTTVEKAKELRPFAEKLITLAKKESLHARRLVLRDIQDQDVVKKLFEKIGTRFATRPGGYTRIVRTTNRRGDNAELAIIELVDAAVAPKTKKKAVPAGKKKTEKAVETAAHPAEHENPATRKPRAKKAVAAPAEEAAAVEETLAVETAPEEPPAEAPAAEEGEKKEE